MEGNAEECLFSVDSTEGGIKVHPTVDPRPRIFTDAGIVFRKKQGVGLSGGMERQMDVERTHCDSMTWRTSPIRASAATVRLFGIMSSIRAK